MKKESNLLIEKAKRSLEAAEVLLYKNRWIAVNKRQIKELAQTSIHKKFVQLKSLLTANYFFINRRDNSKKISEVRNRWNLLRRRVSYG